jgi:two-component system sensor kinase FixL
MLFAASIIISNALTIGPTGLLVIWLPQAVMVASLLLLNRRDCVWLLALFTLGIFADLVWRGMAPGYAAIEAIIQAGGVCAISWLYWTLEGRRLPTETTRALAVFVGAAIFGCAMSSVLAAMLETSAQINFNQTALQWLMAPLLGTLTLAPAMLSWADASNRGARMRLNLELALILAGIALSASLALFVGQFFGALPLASAFLMMPWLVWAALRRPGYETATLLFLTVLVARFEIAFELEAGRATPEAALLRINWLLFILVVLAVFVHFLMVKTRERDLAENLLQEREVKFDAVFNTSPDAVIVADQKGLIEAFNPAAQDLFGYSAEELIGKSLSVLMPPYLADRHDGYMHNYHKTGEKRIIGIGRVVTGQRRDGSTFPIELAVGEANVNGRIFYTGFIRDLTEKQGAEQRIHELQGELMHATRLASLGEISSTVAHEVNQPLSAAGTYMEVAEQLAKAGTPEALARAAETMSKASAQVKRAADIIRRVRDFARKRAPELSRVNVNRIIEEACALAFVGTRNIGVRGDMDLSPDLPDVLIDRIQIQQVLVNLIRNSIDAMAGTAAGMVVVRSRRTADGSVEVSVSDNGPGVLEEIRDSLFTPFSTSKPDGTGLGLAVCKSIIEAHGGKIWYEPNPAGGSVFAFTFPVEPQPESRV